MASGSFPSLPLSVNGINVAFYGGTPPAGSNTLVCAATISRLTLPIKISDFVGLPYCQIHPVISSMGWSSSEYGTGVACCSCLQIIPDKTFAVYSKPVWITTVCNQTTNFICIYPTTCNSGAVRSGFVCICETTGDYKTRSINVTQNSII